MLLEQSEKSAREKVKSIHLLNEHLFTENDNLKAKLVKSNSTRNVSEYYSPTTKRKSKLAKQKS